MTCFTRHGGRWAVALVGSCLALAVPAVAQAQPTVSFENTLQNPTTASFDVTVTDDYVCSAGFLHCPFFIMVSWADPSVGCASNVSGIGVAPSNLLYVTPTPLPFSPGQTVSTYLYAPWESGPAPVEVCVYLGDVSTPVYTEDLVGSQEFFPPAVVTQTTSTTSTTQTASAITSTAQTINPPAGIGDGNVGGSSTTQTQSTTSQTTSTSSSAPQPSVTPGIAAQVKTWARRAVARAFGRGKTPTSLMIGTCAKSTGGAYRCSISWRTRPWNYSGTVLVSNSSLEGLSYHFKLIAINGHTHQQRHITISA